MPEDNTTHSEEGFTPSLDQPPLTDLIVGALLGFFLLHPVAMALVGRDVSLQNIIASFGTSLGAYFAFIGMMTGLTGGILRYQLKKQNRKLAHANKELSSAVAERESLLRVISHDITNAMVSASAALTMVERRAHKTQNFCENSEDFSEIASEARATLANAQQLLDFTKRMLAIQSGKLVMDLERQDLRPIVQSAAGLYREKAEAKSLDILVETPDVEVYCAVEPVVLRNTVFGNLISNAVKFSLPGKRVRIELTKRDGRAFFSVVNLGTCIPGDLADRLFSPEACTTRLGTCGEQGTGFGLPLVAQFAEKMQGTVRVESDPAPEEYHPKIDPVCRTRFTVELPTAR
ncbi:MAG: ATP-binding protein [Oceanidesulfovibrio sp.]